MSKNIASFSLYRWLPSWIACWILNTVIQIVLQSKYSERIWTLQSQECTRTAVLSHVTFIFYLKLKNCVGHAKDKILAAMCGDF